MFWCTKRYFMNGDPKTDDRRKGGAPFPDCHCRARTGNPCQRRHPDSPQRLGATAKWTLGPSPTVPTEWWYSRPSPARHWSIILSQAHERTVQRVALLYPAVVGVLVGLPL